MQKKIAVIFLFLISMMAFGDESIEIQKEVTGVDRQILEESEGVESVDSMQQLELKDVDVNLKSNDLRGEKETLVVEQEKSSDDLEKELSRGMSSDKSWLRYILGAVLLVAGIAAF